jgi:hypothetical protein
VLSLTGSATYTITPPTATATPTPSISPAAGSYATPTVVTIGDSVPGAVVYYTTDGSTPTPGSPVYSGPFTVSASQTVTAVALAAGDILSGSTSAVYTIQSPSLSYPTGFTPQGLALNGGASVKGTVLQLTDGGKSETRSAYFTSPMNVQAFTTNFHFQLTSAFADGFTFVIQNQGLTALGAPTSGLGYGLMANGTGASIGKSIAIKFDIHNDSGEGTDSTGLYLDGASPTTPYTNLSTTGIKLTSGHVIYAQLTYNGTNLSLTLTDTTTGSTVTEVYPVNIPAAVGGNTAYFGFTAASGGSVAIQNILDWTYATR